MDIREVNKGDFLTSITITSDRKKRKFIEIIEIYCVNERSVAGSQVTAEILKDSERFSQHYFERAVEYGALLNTLGNHLKPLYM